MTKFSHKIRVKCSCLLKTCRQIIETENRFVSRSIGKIIRSLKHEIFLFLTNMSSIQNITIWIRCLFFKKLNLKNVGIPLNFIFSVIREETTRLQWFKTLRDSSCFSPNEIFICTPLCEEQLQVHKLCICLFVKWESWTNTD